MYTGAERSGLLLYRACLDPLSEHSEPIYNVMIINQILLYVLDMMTIFCNLFLYRFLSLQTEMNTGIISYINSPADIEKISIKAKNKQFQKFIKFPFYGQFLLFLQYLPLLVTDDWLNSSYLKIQL